MGSASLLFAAASLATGIACAQDAQVLLQKHDCRVCHVDHETRAGPAFADVAGKYRDKPNAVVSLVAVIRKGAHGAGPWPMPPLPQVPSADANEMAAYILALKKQGAP